jgi:glycosyltransferase involved in cell wall biosynthesis
VKFSVLISVYEKEEPTYFDEALRSVIMEQTRIPSEVVIVKDGPLSLELEKVIKKYQEGFMDIVKVVGYEKNRGLGEALNFGIKHCSHELIARMDSDDISTNKRFEIQISFMENNPNISVVGSYISEFFIDPNDSKLIRVTPKEHNDIKIKLKRRNPVNHVSVVIRKSDLEKIGGYKHLLYLEDYYLWTRFIGNGFKLHNIEDVFVLVRTGKNMYKRRSNPEYIRSWKILQDEMLNMKLINSWDYIINMINIVGFIYMPVRIKESIYKNLLRVKSNR